MTDEHRKELEDLLSQLESVYFNLKSELTENGATRKSKALQGSRQRIKDDIYNFVQRYSRLQITDLLGGKVI